MEVVIGRFEIYLVTLDPTVGAEIRKTRPCVIISPDEMNDRMQTVLVAPLTSMSRPLPFRVDSEVGGKRGQIALDQIRAVDRHRLVKRVGKLDRHTSRLTVKTLLQMFS
ncbi:MAG TPA: type II toxin-antitoxin system PemK/MazF family toxin [Tepidisphaeraceae bacterium]|jgi:mRNA interferase MazF